MTTRGIREIPVNIDPDLRNFLQDLQQQVKALRSTQTPLPIPSNFKVVPTAFGNILNWTRVVGAEYYNVLWSPTPNMNKATIQGVGDSQQWHDHVGNVGITRYYAIQAKRYTGAGSVLTPVLSGVTLAAATGITPPVPPPASHIVVIDVRTGQQIPYVALLREGLK